MRRILKWAGIGLAFLLLCAASLVAVAWAVTSKGMSRTYTVADAPLRVDANADALARGKHLFDTRGCGDCHGPQGAGRVLIDDPGLGRIVPPNLTRSLRNPAYTDDALAAAITPEYGRYIAQSCTGCHGANLAGGVTLIPGKPASANLTPHPNGLAQWKEDDFLRLMHTGHRPDGTSVDPLMPWAVYNNMEEVELRAVWADLRSIDPVAGRGQVAKR
jgi:mono/diheme cytochrome c family protein